MPRILAVDFGERRIGLATSDESGSLATPRVTLLRKSDEVVLDELARFAAREEIAMAVFGIPRSPEGIESPIAGRIRSFAAKFERKTGLPVRFHEETLTSNEASRRLQSTRRASKDDVDRAAAAVLLEDFLSTVPRGTP